MRIINWIKDNIILSIIVVIGIMLRMYNLEYQSPWGDELYTMINTTTDKSFYDIFQNLKIDVHPPLYYYIVHIFNFIFGNTLFSARIVSVILGVFGFYGIYLLGKELFNKKAATIAVSLLAVNYFHIYHSQEARMYCMMFFTTAMSFLFLIKFIKKPTLKSALLHSIFACLMIYTQFFALFTLLAQYLILLYFLIKPIQITQKKFFVYSLISGVVTAILYIPSWIIFFSASKRDSFWIPIPEKDVYTVMFKEFFGFAEIPLMICLLAVIYFFIKLFQRSEKEKFKINPIEEKQTFAFFIIFVWIMVTLIIPLIMSFINLPMIVSRYFINILPALLLLVAAGLNYIKNDLVKVTLIVTFLIFSYSDLVFVKAFYRGIMKTQYREVCLYVKDKHVKDEPIYSSFEYYMSYYLKEKDNHKVDKLSLNEIAAMNISESKTISPFWYLDIGSAPDVPTEQTLKILDSLYVVDDNITMMDCYAKHYQPKATYKPNIEFNKFKKPYGERNGDAVNYSIEVFNENTNNIEISGWIYFENHSMIDSKIHLILLNENDKIIIPSENVNRNDVTTYFKSKYDLSNSGFKTNIIKGNYPQGEYNLSIYVKDQKSNKETLIVTDKKVVFNK
jgi:uncharacterized membrane protein